MINSLTDHRGALNRLAQRQKGAQPGRAAANGSTDDWHITAFVFAIIGGLAALWAFDLSLVSGGLAAMMSAVAGLVFANG